MRVVDTSAWVEWLAGSPTGRSLREHIPQPEHHVVPTMVHLELAIWAAREVSQIYADGVVAETQKYTVIPLDTKIAKQAASFRRSYNLATADAEIYATALLHDADLLTCDKHFEGLPHVVYLPRIAS